MRKAAVALRVTCPACAAEPSVPCTGSVTPHDERVAQATRRVRVTVDMTGAEHQELRTAAARANKKIRALVLDALAAAGHVGDWS